VRFTNVTTVIRREPAPPTALQVQSHAKSFLESGFFSLRALTICALFFSATLLGYFGFAAPGQRGLSAKPKPAGTIGWQSKVEASVLSAASAGETEFMINLASADLGGAAALRTKAEKGTYVFQQLTAAAEATQPVVRQTLQMFGARYQAFWVANVIWAKGNLAVLQAIAQLPQVAYVSSPGSGGLKLPPQDRSASESAPVPAAPQAPDAVEPNLIAVHADQVWAMGYSGQGAVVAGCDSGVHWTHAALKNHYRGWNGTTANHDYNWHDGIHNVNPGCPGDSPESHATTTWFSAAGTARTRWEQWWAMTEETIAPVWRRKRNGSPVAT
jgi:hypothetical protein